VTAARSAPVTAARSAPVTAALIVPVVLVAVLGLPPGAGGAPTARPSVATLAGTGAFGFGGDRGPARRATLAAPSGIAVDGAGDVVFADTDNCRVRMIAARSGRHFGIVMRAGRIYTIAGSGCRARRSPGRPAPIGFPTGVAFDASGDVLIAAASQNRVLELPVANGRHYGVSVRAGHLTTVAGTGAAGPARDGVRATASDLDDPQGIAVAADGDLFIADTGACTVDIVPARSETRFQMAMTEGRLYSVAGTGVCGSAGDGGPAVRAQLWAPEAVALDRGGDLLIADEGDSAVREVAATTGSFYDVPIAAGDIATVAGQDMYSQYLTDGLSAAGPVADVNYPSGIAVDAAGDLFIADSDDRSIRDVPARNGVLFGRAVKAGDMYTLAGLLPVGGSGPAGDGTRWVLTRLVYPSGVAVGAHGALYVTDQGANTVRRITGS
jgi:hypothetical protein